jgi:hypothetical protein
MTFVEGVHHVTFLTEDIDRLAAFYERVFEARKTLDMTEEGVRHIYLEVGPTTVLHPFQLFEGSTRGRAASNGVRGRTHPRSCGRPYSPPCRRPSSGEVVTTPRCPARRSSLWGPVSAGPARSSAAATRTSTALFERGVHPASKSRIELVEQSASRARRSCDRPALSLRRRS